MPVDHNRNCLVPEINSPVQPLDETAGRRACRGLGVAYQGVPTVEYSVSFRSPSSVDTISPNGNCVFLALLHGIGGNKDQQKELRAALFQYMLRDEITAKLKAKYDHGFDTCLSHRATVAFHFRLYLSYSCHIIITTIEFHISDHGPV